MTAVSGASACFPYRVSIADVNGLRLIGRY